LAKAKEKIIVQAGRACLITYYKKNLREIKPSGKKNLGIRQAMPVNHPRNRSKIL